MALRKNKPVDPKDAASTKTASPSAGPGAAAPEENTAENAAAAAAGTDTAAGAGTAEAQTAQAELVDDGKPEDDPKLAKKPAPPATRKPAQGGALATSGPLGLVSPYNQLENQLPPGELEFGSIPRYTASNGQIMDSDKRQIGTWAQFEPVSFNDLYMMAPGDNDDESKEFLKFSYDGVMCTDGATTMEEALKAAQEAGYDKASVKKYIEVFGILLSAEKLADGDPALGKLVMFSLSPQSVKAWNGFKAQAAVQLKLNRSKPEDLRVIKASVKVATFGGNTFSFYNFEI